MRNHLKIKVNLLALTIYKPRHLQKKARFVNITKAEWEAVFDLCAGIFSSQLRIHRHSGSVNASFSKLVKRLLLCTHPPMLQKSTPLMFSWDKARNVGRLDKTEPLLRRSRSTTL